ncbi:MAG: hypothetical protein QF859_03205 [Candidatus Marinimicrobia bacterium]|nr:hypothetical protein [Candidatus Neomarinimicrobiota bacterium]MDP7474960.1 hypothetical protein [Candidatus Neomarinimicrobiota bacterium]MDP7526814.1 hypothetical protein [Candidatus Neomarinimicrobiota bacterium]HJN69220.1 hypothetical protein [Candidatus Neomarinimicrobiota bacterium]
MDNHHQIRILRVIYCMNRGGIKNWLMSHLRIVNKDLFQMDFFVLTTNAGRKP